MGDDVHGNQAGLDGAAGSVEVLTVVVAPAWQQQGPAQMSACYMNPAGHRVLHAMALVQEPGLMTFS